jgi:hypothetical protein
MHQMIMPCPRPHAPDGQDGGQLMEKAFHPVLIGPNSVKSKHQNIILNDFCFNDRRFPTISEQNGQNTSAATNRRIDVVLSTTEDQREILSS